MSLKLHLLPKRYRSKTDTKIESHRLLNASNNIVIKYFLEISYQIDLKTEHIVTMFFYFLACNTKNTLMGKKIGILA